MNPRGARAIRGAAIAAFATLVASLAHTVGGGTPPGVLALALSLAFSAPLAMLLAGERMSLHRAAGAALAAQAALHLLYAVGTTSSGPATSATAVGAPHAAHGGAAPVRFDAAALAVVVDHGHAVVMPVAHVVAATLTVAMLAALGRAAGAITLAFGTAVRGVRLLAAVLSGTFVAPSRRHVVPVARDRQAPPIGLVLLSSLRHRGPPSSILAA